jgi:hypothetical protein
MVFGDGVADICNRFTIALDVIGHELAHGVNGTEANLVYLEQSGALNKSVSDVFGSLIKQYTLRQTADRADWLIGDGLLASGGRSPPLLALLSGEGQRALPAVLGQCLYHHQQHLAAIHAREAMLEMKVVLCNSRGLDVAEMAPGPCDRHALSATGSHRRLGRTPRVGELKCTVLDDDVDVPRWLAADRDGVAKSHARS